MNSKNINLITQMKTQLSIEALNALELCSKVAFEREYRIFLIGGVVRDLILNKKIVDVDITVEGNAIDFCHVLAEKNYCKIIQVQPELKTVKAIFANNIEIDFASTRQECYPKPGHLPVVTQIGCKLEDDVLRRDFTINAIAMSLNQNNYGDVIDYVGGTNDLKEGILKILHNNSFYDDPSRIIRCLKFAARFVFHRDENTKELQKKYIKEQMHLDISWARIKSELKQTFSLNSARAYDMFLANNTYELILGEKVDVKGLEIKNLVDKYYLENPWLVYLGTVLKNKQIIDAFCFSRNEKKVFIDKEVLLNNELSLKSSNYEIYKFFDKCSKESILIYYLLTKRKEPLIYLEKLCDIKVELNGEDLIKFGIPKGKKIGIILDELLKQKLTGNLSTKADELKFVKSKIK